MAIGDARQSTAVTAHAGDGSTAAGRARRLPLGLGLAAAAGFAAAVTLAAWLTGDWWAPEAAQAERNLMVARAVLFALAFGLALWVPYAIRRSNRVGRIAFAGWALYLGFWLFGLWPGLVEPDTVELVSHARQGLVFEWFSVEHALLNLALLEAVPHAAVYGPLQVGAMAALLAWATALIADRTRSRVPLIAFTLLAAVSAPLISYTVHYSRDTLFAIGHVALALWVAQVAVGRRALTPGGLVGIAALTGFLSAYRGDGLALLLAVPLLLLALRPARGTIVRGAAVFAAAAALFHFVIPALPAISPQPHAYDLTLRVNPLGAVLQSDFFSHDRDRDLADLGRVIDVARFQQLQHPVDIPAFWAGAYRWDASEEDWAAFRGASNRLFVDNLPTVLGNRVTNFLASSGMWEGGWQGAEYLMEDPGDRVVTLGRDPVLNPALVADPPSEALYEVQQGLIASSIEYQGLGPSGSALHWNLLPWLGVLLAALLAVRRARFEAVVAVVLVSRLPLLFAVAPIAQFKYYNSVHLGGLVVLGLLLTRIPALRRQR